MPIQSPGWERARHAASYVLLCTVGLTMVVPFVWMLSASLKPNDLIKVHDTWWQNWVPGEDINWIERDGQPLRVRVIGRGETEKSLRVRIEQTGPHHEQVREIALSSAQVNEREIKMDAEGELSLKLTTLVPQGQSAPPEPTVSASGVSIKTVHGTELISSSDGRITLLANEMNWLRVRETSRSPLMLKLRTLDPHPLYGKELDLPKSEIHSAWKRDVAWRNYGEAWSAVDLGRAYANSLLVACIITFGKVLTSSLAAYAFARLTFRGRDVLFFGYLATMMIPSAITMIPVYALFARLPALLDGLTGTHAFTTEYFLFDQIAIGRPIGIQSYAALILPGLFTAYGTFMLRQFFLSIPTELEDAARIDGCSALGVWWNVVLPLSTPALASLTVLTFMGAWKEFLWPLIVAQSAELRTLPVALSHFQGEHDTEHHLMMAGALLSLLPVIILFILAQRWFIAGIRLGGVKG